MVTAVHEVSESRMEEIKIKLRRSIDMYFKNTRINEAVVKEIIDYYEKGYSFRKIRRTFGVGYDTIVKIIKGTPDIKMENRAKRFSKLMLWEKSKSCKEVASDILKRYPAGTSIKLYFLSKYGRECVDAVVHSVHEFLTCYQTERGILSFNIADAATGEIKVVQKQQNDLERLFA